LTISESCRFSAVVRDFRLIHRTFSLLLSAVVCVVPSIGSAEEPASGIGILDCVINPSVVADLGSSAPGILGRLHVDRSDFVKAGDVIAELESGVETASVDLAKTRADSTAEVDLRRVNAAFGSRQRKRTKDLFQRNVVSTNDLDERETEARLARIQLRQAVDNQSIAKLELARAEEILKRRTIKSPITGVVMERFKVVGEYVEDQPVARVAQLDPLHVEVIVPVEHLGMVTPGMTAEVWTDVVEGSRWNATVTRVDKVADVASGTYGVRLALPNPNFEIPAGLRCRMELSEKVIQQVAVDSEGQATDKPPAAQTEIAVPAVAEAAKSPPTPAKETSPNEVNTGPVAAPEVVSTDVAPEPAVESAPIVSAAELASAKAQASNGPYIIERTTAETTSAPKAGDDQAADPIEVAAREPRVTPHDVPRSPEPLVGEPVADVEEPAQSVEEAREAEQVVEVVEAEPAAALDPPACRVAGPFQDEVDATRKVVKLRRAGFAADIKSVAKSRRIELKIMTPVLENHAAAQAVIAKMKKAGLSDHYLHKLPAGKRRVYLGIYNSKRFADKRLRELSDAGIKAFARPSKSSKLDYFLVIRGAPGSDAEQMVSRLPITQDVEAEKLGFCDKLAAR
jgi:RND family efflux transporter MFP subunit